MLGVLELLSCVVYVIPRTAVLGAILMTGYLGGATATNVSHRRPVLCDDSAFRSIRVGRAFLSRRPRARTSPVAKLDFPVTL